MSTVAQYVLNEFGRPIGTVYGALDLVNDNGVSDQTSTLRRAYDAASAANSRLLLPAGVFRFTDTLVWDNPAVEVLGMSKIGTQLVKDESGGDFEAISIPNALRGARYGMFTLRTLTGTGGVPPTPGVGHGIVVGESGGAHFHDIDVFYQTGDAWNAEFSPSSTGNFNHYTAIGGLYCGRDGVRIDGHSSSVWMNANLFGNVGYGWNQPTASVNSSFHSGYFIACQGNTAGGAQVAAQNNDLFLYCEGNTGPDITFTAASFQNFCLIKHTDTLPADVVDLGDRNQWIDISAAGTGGFYTELVTRPQRTTNVIGLDTRVKGGKAGTGASPFSGGSAYLEGGDAAGTGNAQGGAARILGGVPVGTGARGAVRIQEVDGYIECGAALNNDVASVSFDHNSVLRIPRMPRLTTAQRDALTASDGLGPFLNTTTGKVQARVAGAWVDLN